jgi:hypothetical protein
VAIILADRRAIARLGRDPFRAAFSAPGFLDAAIRQRTGLAVPFFGPLRRALDWPAEKRRDSGP